MESTNITEKLLIDQRENLFPHYVIFTILTYVITTTILIVNGSIFLAFLVQRFRRPNLSRLSPAGLLVLNLLAADGFVGAVTIIMTATETRNMAAKEWICSARLALSYLALIGSHVALINVAADRYVAIMHTLHYRDWMTMSRSITMIMCGWIVPVAGGVGVIASNTWHPGLITCEQIDSFRLFLSYVWVPSHVIAFLCVIIIQVKVYLQLRRHESTSETAGQILKNYSRRSVQVLYRVTTTFVVCWGPFDVVLLVIIFWPNPVLKIIYDTSAIIAHFSFLVNPCIYSYKTENIRKPVSALCSDMKKALFCNKEEAVVPEPDTRNGTKTRVKEEETGKSTTASKSRSRSRSDTRSTSLESHGHI